MYTPPLQALQRKFKLLKAVVPALEQEGLHLIGVENLDNTPKALRIEIKAGRATRNLRGHVIDSRQRGDGLEELTLRVRREALEGEPYELVFRVASRPHPIRANGGIVPNLWAQEVYP